MYTHPVASTGCAVCGAIAKSEPSRPTAMPAVTTRRTGKPPFDTEARKRGLIAGSSQMEA
jgi:hypothetical protein